MTESFRGVTDRKGLRGGQTFCFLFLTSCFRVPSPHHAAVCGLSRYALPLRRDHLKSD